MASTMINRNSKSGFQTMLYLLLQVTVCAALYKINLAKQHVPVQVNGRTVAYKTAYFGPVFVGYPEPQAFTVVFDTGSAHFFLPSHKCKDESCLVHNRYNRTLSASAVDIDHDGLPIAEDDPDRGQVSLGYGTGEVLGDFITEFTCLGEPMLRMNPDPSNQPNCARSRLVLADRMTAEPFRSFEFDGVLGLGLEALALHPEFNFFSQMSANPAMAPVFGVFLAKHDGAQSQISFGGYDEALVAGPFGWVPVALPEKGYWQVNIHSVSIGNETLDVCNPPAGCTGIVDTGTSLLGVPKAAVQRINLMLARRAPTENANCRMVSGPPLIFDLGDFRLQLDASDYSRPAAMHRPASNGTSTDVEAICRASLFPVDLLAVGPKVFLLGEPLLRKYYTAYDTQRQQVGFALATDFPEPTQADAGKVNNIVV